MAVEGGVFIDILTRLNIASVDRVLKEVKTLMKEAGKEAGAGFSESFDSGLAGVKTGFNEMTAMADDAYRQMQAGMLSLQAAEARINEARAANFGKHAEEMISAQKALDAAILNSQKLIEDFQAKQAFARDSMLIPMERGSGRGTRERGGAERTTTTPRARGISPGDAAVLGAAGGEELARGGEKGGKLSEEGLTVGGHVLSGRYEEHIARGVRGAGKAFGLTSALGAALFMGEGFKQSTDVQQSMQQVLSEHQDARHSAAYMAQQQQGIYHLATRLPFDPKQLAEAYKEIENQGYTGQAALNVLSSGAQLATATHADLGRTLEGLMTNLQDFGAQAQLSSTDANAFAAGMKNMNQQAGQLLSAMGEIKGAKPEELYGALGTVEPTAMEYMSNLPGGGAESSAQVLAALAQLSKVGIHPDQASHNLSRIIGQLGSIPAGSKLYNMLGQLGIKPEDVADTMRNKGLYSSLDMIKGGINDRMIKSGPDQGKVNIGWNFNNEQVQDLIQQDMDQLNDQEREFVEAHPEIQAGTAKNFSLLKSMQKAGITGPGAGDITTLASWYKMVNGPNKFTKQGAETALDPGQVFQILAGTGDIARTFAILGSNTDQGKEMTEHLSTAGEDALSKGFKDMMNTLPGQWKQLGSNLKSLSGQIADHLLPTFITITSDINDFMSKHKSAATALIDAMLGMAGAWVAYKLKIPQLLKGVFKGGKFLWDKLQPNAFGGYGKPDLSSSAGAGASESGAAGALEEAAGTLETGATTLSTGASSFSEAVAIFAEATPVFSEGATAFAAATPTFETGSMALQTGAGTLETAAGTMETASTQLEAAATALDTSATALDTSATTMDSAAAGIGGKIAGVLPGILGPALMAIPLGQQNLQTQAQYRKDHPLPANTNPTEKKFYDDLGLGDGHAYGGIVGFKRGGHVKKTADPYRQPLLNMPDLKRDSILGMLPGGMPVGLRGGEGILTPEAVAKVGGKDGVDALNDPWADPLKVATTFYGSFAKGVAKYSKWGKYLEATSQSLDSLEEARDKAEGAHRGKAGKKVVGWPRGTSKEMKADIRAVNEAIGLSGHKYVYGGLDCSGYLSEIYASMAGLPPGRKFTTTSNFAALGFHPGYMPGALNIGVIPRPGQSGHMAGTLPNGVNVESGGSNGGGTKYGHGAHGALDPQFQQHWWFMPGYAGGGVVGFDGGGIADPAFWHPGMNISNGPHRNADKGIGVPMRGHDDDIDLPLYTQGSSIPGPWSEWGKPFSDRGVMGPDRDMHSPIFSWQSSDAMGAAYGGVLGFDIGGIIPSPIQPNNLGGLLGANPTSGPAAGPQRAPSLSDIAPQDRPGGPRPSLSDGPAPMDRGGTPPKPKLPPGAPNTVARRPAAQAPIPPRKGTANPTPPRALTPAHTTPGTYGHPSDDRKIAESPSRPGGLNNKSKGFGVSGGILGTAEGAAAMAADAFAPGSGEGAQMAFQLANRAIGYGGQLVGILASGLMETFLPNNSPLADPTNNLIGKVALGIAGAHPSPKNNAGNSAMQLKPKKGLDEGASAAKQVMPFIHMDHPEIHNHGQQDWDGMGHAISQATFGMDIHR